METIKKRHTPLLYLLLLLLPAASCRPDRDPFIERLLKQLTLDEKIGQMTQLCFSTVTAGGGKALVMDEAKLRSAILEHHVGSFLSGSGTAEDWIGFVTLAQRVAVEESRLGIPLLIGIDHVHGANYVDEGTILPHNLTLSCSFDTGLVAEAAMITARETLGLGLVWNFAPVLDLGRNPLWPRFYETFGEDPFLCGEMGSSFIRNYTTATPDAPYSGVTCGKHFVGYSDPRSGWDRTPAEIPSQVMWELHIPPFRTAINGGLRTLMLNSGEVNGEPVITSRYLVRELLQQQLGFEGVLLTDIKDIRKVVEMHAGAPDEREATRLAMEAGVDMSMACDSYDFQNHIKALVETGVLSEKRIDQSVRKILQLKKELGLFSHPYPTGDGLEEIGSDRHREAAERMAAESMVLLKNEQVLPFPADARRILLGGFAVHSKMILNGAWTHQWMGVADSLHSQATPTLLEAMQDRYGQKQIEWVPDGDPLDPAYRRWFAERAGRCDLIVLTLGEYPYSEFKGNMDNLELDDRQQELVRLASSTGKPLVLVLLEGRPRVITAVEPLAEAILFAGIPGCGGAEAIAGLISGEINPSGKLSFTYPGSTGHLVPYNHKYSEQYTPLYPFGAGLSYTRYSCHNMEVSDTLITEGSPIVTVSVTIRNSGPMAGKETVLLFLRDRTGRITRPVRRLVAFRKVDLAPGEEEMVSFRLVPGEHFSYPDRNGNRILEPGWFDLIAGSETVSLRYRN